MSNLSLENTLNNIFDTVTETNIELPREIRISDKKFKRKFMTLNDNTNEQKIEIM